MAGFGDVRDLFCVDGFRATTLSRVGQALAVTGWLARRDGREAKVRILATPGKGPHEPGSSPRLCFSVDSVRPVRDLADERLAHEELRGVLASVAAREAEVVALFRFGPGPHDGRMTLVCLGEDAAALPLPADVVPVTSTSSPWALSEGCVAAHESTMNRTRPTSNE